MHKVAKVVTREWRKAKTAKLEFVFVSAFRDNSTFGLNILGPLCLWQCFNLSLWERFFKLVAHLNQEDDRKCNF